MQAAKRRDLILFLGQSNMQGQTERLSEQDPVDCAWEYRFLTDTLAPLQNPVGENIFYDLTPGYPLVENEQLEKWLKTHVLGSAVYGHTNMVPEFCRAYIRESGHGVIAVHAAKGSTVIADWLPGTAGYEAVVKKAEAALRKCADDPPGGVYAVWLQGESNAVLATPKEKYKESLIKLKEGLENDIGLDRFCIIRVGPFANDARDDAIMAAQEEVCRNDGFLMLTRIAGELLADRRGVNPNVAGHFSAWGLETLGRTAGRNLAQMLAKENKGSGDSGHAFRSSRVNSR